MDFEILQTGIILCSLHSSNINPGPSSSGQAGLPSTNPSASYWLQPSDVSQKFGDYRSTPDLPQSADTVIVGSGITGAFAAWFLLEQTGGAKVVVRSGVGAGAGKEENSNGGGILMLEARRQPCSGATGRNGGHCQPFVYSASTPSIAEFELATYQFLKAFVEEHGIAGAVDWRTLKTVHAYLTEEVWEGAKALVEKLPEGLRGQVDLVDETRKGKEGGETLRDLRVPGAKGAVVQKHAASLWPWKLVTWVLERLLERFPVGKGTGEEGFNLQTNTPVLGLEKLGDGKWTVITNRGNIKANRVLLAMNGYTSNLLPEMKDLIVPVRSQVASLRPPKDAASGKVAELDYSYAFVSEEQFPRDEYLMQRPLPGGELIYGGARSHAENKAVGVWQDDEVERGVATYLRQNLAPYPLDLDKTGSTPTDTPKEGNETTELEATHQWTGIMGFSRDSNPWVGRVPESLGGGENLYMCAGYTGHGMPQAALAARMIAEEITGKPFADDGLKLPREMALTEERVRWVRENTKTLLKEQHQAPEWSATMPELLTATERRA
ncbi:FAD dependent oxidoreductase-domain-containing protein [Neurospora hispaniola]|uniref:FAD dependent oxidoreductase-domain-containing protein n=1 Tax=Neurospora hispaniola TaxID=588809 RepID=A0AAJ0IFR3_9PEZI|nr:FAD dependent oxidoreductase-domain-containing protein [Neurospora hispaniola]